MIIEYAVPSPVPNCPYKKYRIIYESVYSYLCIRMETNTHARVNL